MNKRKKIILISIIGIILIVGRFIYVFEYESKYKITTISEHVNPNNNYTILFQSVGAPFLFGPDNVKVTLLNDKMEETYAFDTSISDDGAKANENSIKVRWFKSYVEITLLGSEQQDKTYKIDYK